MRVRERINTIEQAPPQTYTLPKKKGHCRENIAKKMTRLERKI